MVDVSDSTLITVTESADSAFKAVDFSVNAAMGVRVYLQGFG
jgi:hypothetical protein